MYLVAVSNSAIIKELWEGGRVDSYLLEVSRYRETIRDYISPGSVIINKEQRSGLALSFELC